MRRLLFILCIVPFFVSSCTPSPEKSVDDEVDRFETSRDSLMTKFRAKRNEELNLEQLENGVDTFELRLTTTIGILKTHYGQLLVIKKNRDRWLCLEYNYIYRNAPFGAADEERLRQYAIDTFWIYKKQPKSGWNKFLLCMNDIRNLPADSVIDRGLDSLGVVMADGVDYSFELADRNGYKRYHYNSPQQFATYALAFRNATHVINLFDTEFELADDLDKIIERLPEEVVQHYDSSLRAHISEFKKTHSTR